MRFRQARAACAFGIVLACTAGVVLMAATAVGQVPPAAPKSAPPARQAVMPDAERIVVLIRTTLLTLNDALRTGNFTVLRDVAAPAFRDANSAARLGAVFGNLAQRGIDLSAVAILAPQLSQAPAIDPRTGMLHIKGTFPGQPVRIDFDLLYQLVEGRWRVFGLSVQPVTTPIQTPTADNSGAPRTGTRSEGSQAKPDRAR